MACPRNVPTDIQGHSPVGFIHILSVFVVPVLFSCNNLPDVELRNSLRLLSSGRQSDARTFGQHGELRQSKCPGRGREREHSQSRSSGALGTLIYAPMAVGDVLFHLCPQKRPVR